MTETYIITGGAGFIGSHLAERLLKDGQRVRIIDNFSTGKRANLAAPAAAISKSTRSASPTAPRSRRSSRARITSSTKRRWRRCRAASTTRWRPTKPTSPARSTCCSPRAMRGQARGLRRVVVGLWRSRSRSCRSKPCRRTRSRLTASPSWRANTTVRRSRQVYGLETVALRYFNVFGPRQDETSQYAAVIPQVHRGDAGRQTADDLRRRHAVARLHLHR